MRDDFAKRLTLVRKERGISQKQAAADLEVSQALLSHYERGVRECGLEFVARAARYYGVSSDYLLGLSAHRSGEMLSGDDLPDPSESQDNKGTRGGLANLLGKRLVFNALNMIYDVAAGTGSRPLSHSINDYFYLSVYRVFRMLYSANPDNEEDFFLIDKERAPYYCVAALAEAEAAMRAACAELGENAPALGQAIIEQQYDRRAGGVLNLVKNAEALARR